MSGTKSPQEIYDAVMNGGDMVNLIGELCGSDGNEIKQVAEALKNAETQVKHIDLCFDKLCDAGATAIAESLETNTTLETLNLSDNEIGDVGAAALAEALKTNTILETFDLSGNDIGEVGLGALAEGLKVNTALRILDLSYNDIGDAGALAIVKALESNKTLKTLRLCYNKITDGGATSIATALETKRHFLESLDLNLDGNEISADLITRIKTALTSLPKILMNAILANDSYDEETICDRVGRRPEQCREKNSDTIGLYDDGLFYYQYPLYWLCRLKPSLRVVRLVYKEYPPALLEQDSRNQTPMHMACQHGAPVDVIRFLVDKSSSNTLDIVGSLLHCACKSQDSTHETVELLCNYDPQAVRHRDTGGKIALHIACQEGANLEVIKFLLEKYPSGAKSKDDTGLLPWHYACKHGKRLDVVEYLAHLGKTQQPVVSLLHNICKLDEVSAVVVDFVRYLFPESLHERDSAGRLPIHLACQVGNAGVVKLLVSKYLDGLKVKDNHGLIPLHYAYKHVNLGLAEILLTEYFEGVYDWNKDGQTPLPYGKSEMSPAAYLRVRTFQEACCFGRERQKQKLADYFTEKQKFSTITSSLSQWTSESVKEFKRGVDCFEGNGVAKNMVSAAGLFRKAAEKGHTEAMYRTACCYDSGLGFTRDLKQAAEFYKKAASHGHPDSIFNLAVCHDFGRGVELDRRRASKYYRKAALEGNIFAIAFIYLYGVGVEQDFMKAFEALLLATEKQSPLAPSTLARVHLSGCGTPVSIKSATECLEQDIERPSSDPESTFMLAEIYASSMEPADLRTANKLISCIEESSSVYERAQWLRPFIDDQLARSREGLIKWDVKPGPDFVMDADLQLIAFIGKGHFGKVFLAWHRSREAWVAVKFMNVGLVQDNKDAVRTILRERFTCRVIDANRANIPNVVRYEGFVDDLGPNMQRGLVFPLCADLSYVLEDAIREREKPFVASRFSDPESLPDWSADVPSSLRSAVVFANRGRWSLSTMLRMLRQVAEALEGVHGLGFLHCDIAPRNVLCDGDGNVKLADFGLARFVGRWGDDCCQLNTYGKYLTDGHQYAFAWWAPECIGAERREAVFSTNSDVYSFGTLMWQCFAHCDPYSDIQPKSDDPQEMRAAEIEMVNRILTGVRPDLDRIDKDTPPELIALISNCWETDPENRPILRNVIEKLKEIEKKPHRSGPLRNRNPKMLKEKWFKVNHMYRSLPLSQLRERAENTSGQGAYSCQLLYSPFDIFLAHSGEQKELAVDTMADSFSRSGFRCFFDKDMKNSNGAPTEQMRFAMEQCRHVVVVLSKSFLERDAPCQELVYAFERMEWLRQQMYSWRSLWIVLFDVSLEVYKQERKTSKHQLPDIGSQIVLLEWKSGNGKFDGWMNLCNKLKTQIIEHDNGNAALSKWRSFLDEKKQFGSTFPRAGNVYAKTE